MRVGWMCLMSAIAERGNLYRPASTPVATRGDSARGEDRRIGAQSTMLNSPVERQAEGLRHDARSTVRQFRSVRRIAAVTSFPVPSQKLCIPSSASAPSQRVPTFVPDNPPMISWLMSSARRAQTP